MTLGDRRLSAAPEPRRLIVVVADGRLVRSRLSGALDGDAPTQKRLLDAFGLVADCGPRRPATVEGIRPIAPHGLATSLDRRLGCPSGFADTLATYGRPAARSTCGPHRHVRIDRQLLAPAATVGEVMTPQQGLG
jgi:hypothetical protein